jgi:hypothetical protein
MLPIKDSYNLLFEVDPVIFMVDSQTTVVTLLSMCTCKLPVKIEFWYKYWQHRNIESLMAQIVLATAPQYEIYK